MSTQSNQSKVNRFKREFRGLTEEERKTKFRELAFKHHPDHGGNEEDFKMLKEAFISAGKKVGLNYESEWSDLLKNMFGVKRQATTSESARKKAREAYEKRQEALKKDKPDTRIDKERKLLRWIIGHIRLSARLAEKMPEDVRELFLELKEK